MFGTLAFIAVALVIVTSIAALRQQALNSTTGRHRLAEPMGKHRWAEDSCWKPVCGCARKHQLPPQAIIERLRREEARAVARYATNAAVAAAAI